MCRCAAVQRCRGLLAGGLECPTAAQPAWGNLGLLAWLPCDKRAITPRREALYTRRMIATEEARHNSARPKRAARRQRTPPASDSSVAQTLETGDRHPAVAGIPGSIPT